MKRARIIPVLLLRDGGLVKSTRFKDHKYVGDPLNAVKIFNEKEVDEVIIVDIDATKKNAEPDFALIGEIASEAFVPLAYGGGVSSIEQITKLFSIGVEKVILNYHAFTSPQLISEAAALAGSQSVVVCIDVKKNWLGRTSVHILNGTKNTGLDPAEYAKKCADLGAGEIMVNSIDRDGMLNGYDLPLIDRMSAVVDVPLICCGGAASLEDFLSGLKHGASAAAAGSYFVFQQPHKAVLITYPNQEDLRKKIYLQL